MPSNKYATIRYNTLDKCFRNTGRRFSIKDLIEACSKAISEHSGKETHVGRSTVYDDIIFMQSEAGWSIGLKKVKDGSVVYYSYEDPLYSITNSPLNATEASQLKEAMLTLERFKGMPQFEWVSELSARLDSLFGSNSNTGQIIEFEYNPYLTGQDFITDIYEAIINKTVLEIEYQGYRKDRAKKLVFHPQYLRQYNNRWFTFGVQGDYEELSNLALDRIISIKRSDEEYRSLEMDFEEYFEDVVGVTIPRDQPVSKIKIEVDKQLYKYIKSKPIHGSQKMVKEKEDSVILEFNLIINYELKSMLLGFGTGLKVLAPDTLVEEFKQIYKTQCENYLEASR